MLAVGDCRRGERTGHANRRENRGFERLEERERRYVKRGENDYCIVYS